MADTYIGGTVPSTRVSKESTEVIIDAQSEIPGVTQRQLDMYEQITGKPLNSLAEFNQFRLDQTKKLK